MSASCETCGIVLEEGEYHLYAACLMYMNFGTSPSKLRGNLLEVVK